MASIEKYTDIQVTYKLRHNTRENPKPPKNIDIDPQRTHLNYFLTPPERSSSARASKDYYNDRLKNVYHYNRADVKTACQWVITAPKDLPEGFEKVFFQETYNFLNSLYGEENCINCSVHFDEGVKDDQGNIVEGRPHLHYMFIPVVKNKKYMKPNKKGNITSSATWKEKVCAEQLINKSHLQKFHPKFQKWMDDHGLPCTVHSGITGGKNRTVEELKAETREKLKIMSLEKENQELKDKLASIKKERSNTWEKEF